MDWFAGILELLKNFFKVLAYWFNPELRKKREREKIWKELTQLEEEYRKALASGDPQQAAVLDKKMRELRAKYEFLGG